MLKRGSKLLELALSGALLFTAAREANIYAGSSSKSFPLTLSSQTSSKKYPAKVNVDVKFGKAKSDYYSHTLEVILSTEDFQKEKNFYEYKVITKNRSFLYLVHDKEVEVGSKVNEEVYVHKMKNKKMIGKWQSTNTNDEKEYNKIRKIGKYAYDALALLGKITLIKDALDKSNDIINYFENKPVEEALEALKTRYVVKEIPFGYPKTGEITAWKFYINMKNQKKGYLAIIPIVHIQQGLISSEIEGRFEGALVTVPQSEEQKKRIPDPEYENARWNLAKDPDTLRRIETALSYYHASHEGDYPASLENLIPDLLESIPEGNWDYNPKTGKIKKKD